MMIQGHEVFNRDRINEISYSLELKIKILSKAILSIQLIVSLVIARLSIASGLPRPINLPNLNCSIHS